MKRTLPALATALFYSALTATILTYAIPSQAELTEAYSSESNTIKLALYEYPPLYHTSYQGEFSGTLGETIKQICTSAGLDCQTQMYPIARAYKLTTTGQADATLSAIHPRFDQCCTASDWSYPWSAGFFTLKDNQQTPPHSEQELTGQSMVIVRGWRSQYRFMPNFDQLVAEKKIQVFYANSNYSAIQMLNHGRADLLWGSVDFLWYINKLKLNDKILYSERLQIPIVLWVNKQAASALERFNNAFKEIQLSGQLDEQNLLRDDIMKQRYQDAPLKETQ